MNQFWTVPRHNPLQPRDDNLKENSVLSDSRRSADMERPQDFPARPLPFLSPSQQLFICCSRSSSTQNGLHPFPTPSSPHRWQLPPHNHSPWLYVGKVLRTPHSAAPAGRGGRQELSSDQPPPPPKEKPDANFLEWGENKEQHSHGAGRVWGSESSQETPPLLRDGEQSTRKQNFT